MRSPSAAISIASLLLVAGCTSGEPATEYAFVQPPPGSSITGLETQDAGVMALVTEEGRRVLFQQGAAVVGDTMAVALPEGRIEYHLTPSAIMAELNRLQSAYVVEKSGELIFFEGFPGNPVVHEPTGQMCWTAVTCTNPRCLGNRRYDKPNVFALPERGVALSATGQIVRTGISSPSKSPPCPYCGTAKFLASYRTPERIEQEERLQAQLAAARAARDKAAVAPER
jgi:hypothetical protein